MTFVMRNDAYIPGALVFAYALRRLHTQADLVCMVTKEVTTQARLALNILFDYVLEIEETYIKHERRQERQDRPFLFTRFQALLVGTDGPFGYNYDKVVLADADVLPLSSYDHLFALPTPAGIINESKFNSMEFSLKGEYIIPDSVQEKGKWIWHKIYDPQCPHGTGIPKYLTDRVTTDYHNMGVNSSLWVLKPSVETYNRIFRELEEIDTYNLVTSGFNWPEMQFATMFWSGEWTSVDLRSSSFNGYPKLDILCGTHFAGYKPWNFKDQGTISRFSRFPDYILWHKSFVEMMDTYPRLHSIKRLSKLDNNIKELKIHHPQGR